MIEVRVPDEQEGTKAVVRAWLKSIGDRVTRNDPLVELETDKVTQEVPSPADGILAEILLDTDAEAVPGAVLGRIEAGSKPVAKAAGRIGAQSSAAPPDVERSAALGAGAASGAGERETRLSPSVRRACLQNGIDPSQLQGTGRNGRVTREDVERALNLPGADATGAAVLPLDSTAIPHDRMRLAIADNMVRSVAEAPHVTALFEADFSAVAAHKAAMAARGTRLSYTAYIVKAAAEAMIAAPAINGRWEKDRIAISQTVDIGVGTALGDKGLVVPVVRNADALSLVEIGARLDELTSRAREGRLERSDVSGGSFTISNHGVSGSLLAAPIILHQGQAAILGIGKLEKRVVVREVGGGDAMLIRPMAYVTLTIDHRVIDGHQTNAWLSRFVDILEHWQRP